MPKISKIKMLDNSVYDIASEWNNVKNKPDIKNIDINVDEDEALVINDSDTINGNYEAALPTVTSSDNGKILSVVNGQWTVINLPLYNGGIN